MFAGSGAHEILRNVCQLSDKNAINFFSSWEDITAKRSAVINSAKNVYKKEKTKKPLFKHATGCRNI